MLEVQRGSDGKVSCRFRPKMEAYSTMINLITSAIAHKTRQLAARYIWTHPNIAQTFRCRPTYQASFRKTWLSLMWGGEAHRRRLRESIAVAISAANQCLY